MRISMYFLISLILNNILSNIEFTLNSVVVDHHNIFPAKDWPIVLAVAAWLIVLATVAALLLLFADADVASFTVIAPSNWVACRLFICSHVHARIGECDFSHAWWILYIRATIYENFLVVLLACFQRKVVVIAVIILNFKIYMMFSVLFIDQSWNFIRHGTSLMALLAPQCYFHLCQCWPIRSCHCSSPRGRNFHHIAVGRIY